MTALWIAFVILAFAVLWLYAISFRLYQRMKFIMGWLDFKKRNGQ